LQPDDNKPLETASFIGSEPYRESEPIINGSPIIEPKLAPKSEALVTWTSLLKTPRSRIVKLLFQDYKFLVLYYKQSQGSFL